MAQAKVKTMTDAIFKARSCPIPAKMWHSLLVRNEGTEVSQLMENWGAPDLQADPAITLMISARETTGRVTSSKLVIRGPTFVVRADDQFRANNIWPGLENDITLSFTISGEILNFSNREARNVSTWTGLDTLPSFKVYKDGTQLSREEFQTMEGLKDGACFRVAVQVHSTTHMAATLLVAPKTYTMVKTRAREWNIAPESNRIPGINITNHWTRYVQNLPGLNAGHTKLNTVTRLSAKYQRNILAIHQNSKPHFSGPTSLSSSSTSPGRTQAKASASPSSPS